MVGFTIRGSVGNGGMGILLYKDASPDNWCDEYPDAGTSVCSDVITTPINSDQPVRNITIAYSERIFFCEIEVFTGKILYYYEIKQKICNTNTLTYAYQIIQCIGM